MNENREYEEIINLPHFEPKNHRRMSRYMRAAQFAPFASLTGYDEDIAEEGRLTDEKYEPNEYELAALNSKIGRIIENIKSRPEVTLTYFKPDEKKQGGKYLTERVKIRLVNENERFIETVERKRINLCDIAEIK